MNEKQETNTRFIYFRYIFAVLVTGVIAFIFSGLGLAFLMQYPALMIKAGLIFVVVMSLVWCVMAFLSGSIFGGVIGLVFFLIGLCYARAVWSRIPFGTYIEALMMTANFPFQIVMLTNQKTNCYHRLFHPKIITTTTNNAQ